MKAKQLIERNLPFNNKYVYTGITRGSIESGQLTYCDNCGKLITNMVSVYNNTTGVKYTIGTDCSDTLVKANCLVNGVNMDYHLDIYSYNLAAKFVTELNAGATLIKSDWQCTLINRKGKEMRVFTNDLKKYFPQYFNFSNSLLQPCRGTR